MMAGPAAILRELHRLRRYARDLEMQIEREPKALDAQRRKVTRQEEALRQAQDAIKKLKVSNHEKEVTLRTKAQQVAKHGITEEMIHAKAASIQGAHLALFDRLIANRQTSSRVLLNDQERRERKAKKSQRRRAQPNAVSPDAEGTVAKH